jgi:uncharacterized protein (DUF885 family)
MNPTGSPSPAASEQLRTEEEIRATGAEEARLNNIESPVQILRQVFDLMPTATAEDWAVIARRLTRLPDAIDSYLTSLTTAAARGDIVPRRQVDAGIAQSRESAAPNGFFATFAAGAAPADGELPNAIRQDLDRGAADAARAYDALRPSWPTSFSRGHRPRMRLGETDTRSPLATSWGPR